MSLFTELTRLLAYYGEDGPWFEPQAHSADRTASALRRVCLSFRESLWLCVIDYLGSIRPSETQEYPGAAFRECYSTGEAMPGFGRGTTTTKKVSQLTTLKGLPRVSSGKAQLGCLEDVRSPAFR